MHAQMPVLLRSQLRDLPDGVEVAVSGELSILTAPALGCLLSLLADDGPQRVVVDLRDADVVVDLRPLEVRWALRSETPLQFRYA